MNSKTTATAAKEEAKPSLVPKRRFPEFRGMDGWKSTTLGEVTIKTDKRNKGGKSYPVYSISNKTGFTPQSEQFEGVDSEKRGYDIALYKLIESNTFAYNPARINVGSIGYSGDLNNVIISSLYVCFKAKPETADQFLQHFFGTSDFEKSVNNHVEGGIRSYLFYENFARIPIPLPSPSEQQKIAECLSSLDELMAAQARKVDALKIHKKGLMQQVFPREGETQPRLRFPEFQNAGEWTDHSVGELGKVVTGSTPSTAKPAFYGGGIPFVSPADISDLRFVDQTKTTLTPEGFTETRPVRAGSVLFVCIGSTIGKVAQIVHDCATNQQINAVIPSSKHSDDFVYFALSYASERIALLAGRQAVPIINKSLFSSVRILAPKLPEQQRIATCLSSLDALITAETQKLEALKTHKKGLMQQLFPSEEVES